VRRDRTVWITNRDHLTLDNPAAVLRELDVIDILAG
jgi:hypothetical protein